MEDISTPSRIRQQQTQWAKANYELALSEARSQRQKTIAESSENNRATLQSAQQLLLKAKNRVSEARDTIEKRLRLDEYLKLRQHQERLIGEANRAANLIPVRALEIERLSIVRAREDLHRALKRAAEAEKKAYDLAREDKKWQRKLAQLVEKEARRNGQSARVGNQKIEEASNEKSGYELTVKPTAETERSGKPETEKRQAKEARKQQRAAERTKLLAERQAREAQEKERTEKARLTQKEAREKLERGHAVAKAGVKNNKTIKEQIPQTESTPVVIKAYNSRTANPTPSPSPEPHKMDYTSEISIGGAPITKATEAPTPLGESGALSAASSILGVPDPESDFGKLPVAATPGARAEMVTTASSKDLSRLQQGLIKLVINTPEEATPMKELERCLRSWRDIRLEYIGCDGATTSIIVSISRAIPVVDRLRDLSIIKEVIGKGNEFKISLNSSK